MSFAPVSVQVRIGLKADQGMAGKTAKLLHNKRNLFVPTRFRALTLINQKRCSFPSLLLVIQSLPQFLHDASIFRLVALPQFGEVCRYALQATFCRL